MDANGQRFWMLADAAQFPTLDNTVWDAECRVLRLASRRTLTDAMPSAAAFGAAQGAIEAVPRAIDPLGCVARWDSASSSVIVASLLPGEVTLLGLAQAPSDLCMGVDGVLYIAQAAGVRLHDLRDRWDDQLLELPGFAPWRLAPAQGGGVWALERSSGRLARLTGLPLRRQTPPPEAYDGRVFRPQPANANEPTLTLLSGPLAADERAIALAASPSGALALLVWQGGDGLSALRQWTGPRFGPLQTLQGARFAYSLAWLAPDRIAVRLPGYRDAPAFDLPPPATPAQATAPALLPAVGEIYPLADTAVAAAFANGAVLPPHYPVGTAQAQALDKHSLRQLAQQGSAASFDASASAQPFVIDSQNHQTVWHRLVAECAIPAGTGFVVWLASTSQAAPPAATDTQAWLAHGFGAHISSLSRDMAGPQLPHAVWDTHASELPQHSGLLGRPLVKDHTGLFSVLIQNSRRRVRELKGRYLWLRLQLHGDGRSSPEIAALRAYASRFDYSRHYLPRLYRETQTGAGAELPGRLLTSVEATHAQQLDAAVLTPALRARLRLEQIDLSERSTVEVEAPGQRWLLSDGARHLRLAHSTTADTGPDTAIGVYQPEATAADFNSRLLANFEGWLTPLEDRVAAAHLLTDPAVVPPAQLDWLGTWIGVAFDAALPVSARRDWLRAAPDLARRHGTRDGLRLALNIASGGGVAGGEIIVIEDFRLRRQLATLLGVQLSDEHDPLLPGLAISGNSVVGDTLILGDHERRELLALFDASVATAEETAAVERFQSRLAHQATVLVHQDGGQNLGLLRRIAVLAAPAHVAVRVVPASWPLLVGIASLVGVDTYLAAPRRPRPVQLQRSVLGLGDYLIAPAALDPRLAGVQALAAPPVATAAAPGVAASTDSFVLDGRASRAAPGRVLTEYRWRWMPPADV